MKQIFILFLICLFCVSCSDYPTSGGIDMEIVKKHVDGQITIDQSLGVVVEFDTDILDSFKEIKWHQLDLEAVIDNKTHQPDFDVDYESVDIMKEALAVFLGQETDERNGINEAIGNWKRQVEKIKPEVEQTYQSLKATNDEYLGFVQIAKDELDQLNAKKSDLDQQYNQLLKSIVTETNSRIVDERLAFNKLREHGYALKYKQVSWEQDVNSINCHTYSANRRHKRTNTPSYPRESYIVVDKLSQNKSCYYITRPVRGMFSDDYDAFVQKQFDDFLNLEANLAEINEALKTAQKSMSDARIIAKNQTNIDFEKNDKEMQKVAYVLEDINWVLSDLTLDTYFIDGKVDTNQFNKANTANRNIKSHLKKQGMTDQIEVFNQVFEGMRIDPLNKWRVQAESREKYKTSITEYINSLKVETIKKHTIETTSLDDDCTFSGLDGDAAYIVVAAKCQVNGKQTAFRHFFDMSAEEHGYQDKDDLWLNPKKSAINPKNVTEENLNNLLIYPLERGLDDHLEQVVAKFKNQSTGSKK